MHDFRMILLATTTLLAIACAPKQTTCNSDVDCPGAVCHRATGQCVECLDETQCGDIDGGFCCQGVCIEGSKVEENCGCSPDPQGVAGELCGSETPICQSAGARVEPATVQDGTCGCPCDPSGGGTQCIIAAEDAQGFLCQCERGDPVGTCEAPVIDEAGVPHKVADNCPADSVCICLANNPDVCAGGAPDCTPSGCVNLTNDVANCGVAGRTCADDSTGIGLQGTCKNGGCECDAASDCEGDGLNVDLCFIGDNGQACVCDDYEVAGERAACPMELACVSGGCEFDGTAYGTPEALIAAMNGG